MLGFNLYLDNTFIIPKIIFEAEAVFEAHLSF